MFPSLPTAIISDSTSLISWVSLVITDERINSTGVSSTRGSIVYQSSKCLDTLLPGSADLGQAQLVDRSGAHTTTGDKLLFLFAKKKKNGENG